MKTEIKNLNPILVAYVKYLQGYEANGIGKAYETLFRWAGPRDLMNAETKYIGISLDNPEITPPDKCRYYACISLNKCISPEGEIGFMEIPGGKHLIYHFEGFENEIKKAYEELYGSILPQSGYQPEDTPCYEICHKNPDNNPEKKFIMDICVPVKPL